MDTDEYQKQIVFLATATSIGTVLAAVSNQYAASSAANAERFLAAARHAESLANVELATTAEAVRRILCLATTQPLPVKARSSQIDRTSTSVMADFGSPPVVT